MTVTAVTLAVSGSRHWLCTQESPALGVAREGVVAESVVVILAHIQLGFVVFPLLVCLVVSHAVNEALHLLHR